MALQVERALTHDTENASHPPDHHRQINSCHAKNSPRRPRRTNASPPERTNPKQKTQIDRIETNIHVADQIDRAHKHETGNSFPSDTPTSPSPASERDGRHQTRTTELRKDEPMLTHSRSSHACQRPAQNHGPKQRPRLQEPDRPIDVAPPRTETARMKTFLDTTPIKRVHARNSPRRTRTNNCLNNGSNATL